MLLTQSSHYLNSTILSEYFVLCFGKLLENIGIFGSLFPPQGKIATFYLAILTLYSNNTEFIILFFYI